MNALQIPASLFALCLVACSEPVDNSPLGLEMTALLARPEQSVSQVRVQHVLVAFVGAKRGSDSKRDYAAAVALSQDLLARARGGEDFDGLVKKYSGDDGSGTYTLTAANRDDYAQHFTAVAFRLAVGEVGVATFHRTKSPFGFHVIKRLE